MIAPIIPIAEWTGPFCDLTITGIEASIERLRGYRRGSGRHFFVIYSAESGEPLAQIQHRPIP